MWGDYFEVAIFLLNLSQEFLQTETQCCSFWQPHRESFSNFFWEEEEFHGKFIKKVIDDNDTSNYTIRLNSDEIKLPLYVRNRRDGDKIEVKGLNGTKKVKDIFIDEKIKMSDRNTWPVVIDSENKVVWLPGLKKSKLDKKISEEYDIILKYY